jgi:hypothetical protein
MREKESFRESVAGLPTPEYLNARVADGWRLVALEWEREGGDTHLEPQTWVEEIPYGLKISSDCLRLVESPEESQVILAALEMIVDDCPLSQVADELNRRGFKTRGGEPWGAAVLFDLLPRMIQVSPRIFSSGRWLGRRRYPAVGSVR